MKKLLSILVFAILIQSGTVASVQAQDVLPTDNGLATYHTAPRYRESESHPLRIIAYIFHPVGWLAREVVFRPLSYFASSTELTRSVMGYREPFDYRQPECFSADDSAPDCRSLTPFNYGAASGGTRTTTIEDEGRVIEPVRQVYFPNVNFDFNVRKLNSLGKGRAQQVAEILKSEAGVKVVLQGHADYIGSEKYNEKLGMDRAEAVRKELITLGIAPERLSSVSFGESQPIFTQQEDWARAINRRVEVHADDGGPAASALPAGSTR